MFWTQFYLQYADFVIHTAAALVLFAVFWLYFDAWLIKKKALFIPKLMGLALLAASYLVDAVILDIATTAQPLINETLGNSVLVSMRLLAYVLMIYGLITEPIQARPKAKKVTSDNLMAILIPGIGLPLMQVLPALFPLLAGLTALLYWRTATVGLENHLRIVAASFLIISVSELIGLHSLFSTTITISLLNLVAPFKIFWILERLMLLGAVILLGRWVWSYLIKRFQSQLFMIIIGFTLLAFLVTTIIFSGLLLKNIQSESLANMTTNVKVLELALESRQEASLSDAEVLASDPRLADLILAGSRIEVGKVAEDLLLTKNQTSLIITDEFGQIVARGEDNERTGASLSDDYLIKQALIGESASSVVVREGAFAPEISVVAAAPIKKDDKTVGTMFIGTALDNAFVDGVKEATGLEAAIYGGDTLAATTLVTSDEQSRWIGIKLDDKAITKKVLEEGDTYEGMTSLSNVPYFSVFQPIADNNDQIVGMLFVGKPQFKLLDTAARSIETTFIVAVFLMLASVIPSYYVARYLEYQLR